MTLSIPRQAQVRFGISPGAIYIIQREGDDHEHYFVVLNITPHDDDRVILVSATTKHANEERYVALKQFGIDTLVRIEDNESSAIKKASTFNCNRYIDPTIEELCDSITYKRLEYIGKVIEQDILTRLRTATLLSPRLSKKYRRSLKDSESSD